MIFKYNRLWKILLVVFFTITLMSCGMPDKNKVLRVVDKAVSGESYKLLSIQEDKENNEVVYNFVTDSKREPSVEFQAIASESGIYIDGSSFGSIGQVECTYLNDLKSSIYGEQLKYFENSQCEIQLFYDINEIDFKEFSENIIELNKNYYDTESKYRSKDKLKNFLNNNAILSLTFYSTYNSDEYRGIPYEELPGGFLYGKGVSHDKLEVNGLLTEDEIIRKFELLEDLDIRYSTYYEICNNGTLEIYWHGNNVERSIDTLMPLFDNIFYIDKEQKVSDIDLSNLVNYQDYFMMTFEYNGDTYGIYLSDKDGSSLKINKHDGGFSISNKKLNGNLVVINGEAYRLRDGLYAEQYNKIG